LIRPEIRQYIILQTEVAFNMDNLDDIRPDSGPDQGLPLRRMGAPPPDRPGWRKLLKFSLFCILGGLLLLVAGTMLIGHLYPDAPMDSFLGSILTGGKVIQEVFQKPGEVAFAGKERLNILVLGLDVNWTERDIMYTKGARSDTIFVVSLSLADRSVSILSIPRDTRVQIGKNGGYDKINAAYSIGGVELARETVEHFLGVPMDHYVVLRVQGTRTLVDKLGGIPVDVEKDIDYDDNWGHLHVHLKKGWQRLNGEQAVGYARFRYDEEADWGRIRRQQQILRALVTEMKRPHHLVDIPGIAGIMKENLETDINTPEIVDLIRVFRDMDPSAILKGTVGGLDEYIDGIAYIIPDDSEKERLVKRLLLGMDFLEPRDIRLALLNGSDQPGLAARWRDRFLDLGYQVVLVTNADRNDYQVTQILTRNARPKACEMVNQVLGRGQIIPLATAAGLPTLPPPSPSPGQVTPEDSPLPDSLVSDPPEIIVVIGKDMPDPSQVAVPPAPETPPFPSLLYGPKPSYGGDRWILPDSRPGRSDGNSPIQDTPADDSLVTPEDESGWKEIPPTDAAGSPRPGIGPSPEEPASGLLPPSTPVKEYPSRLETPGRTGTGADAPQRSVDSPGSSSTGSGGGREPAGTPTISPQQPPGIPAGQHTP